MSGPVLAVDPGSDKCGLAVVAPNGAIIALAVVRTAQVQAQAEVMLIEHVPAFFIVGDGTWSRKVRPALEQALARARAAAPQVTLPASLQSTSERHTTERARQEYFKANPPRGLWRLVPLGLQVPSVPIDDYAAAVMAMDFLKSLPSPPR